MAVFLVQNGSPIRLVGGFLMGQSGVEPYWPGGMIGFSFGTMDWGSLPES
jgi:hypothetical protein